MTGCLAAGLLLGLAGCGTISPDQAQETVQVFAMDTVMMCTAYGENGTKAAYAAEEEIYRLDALLSRTREDSPVSRLNRAGGAVVDVGAEVCALLEDAGAYSAATGGAFDVTLAPVSSAWGFTEDAFRVPAQAELDALLPQVGMEHLHLLPAASTDPAPSLASLDPGTQIDLGAIAKGYASDRIADIFRENGIPYGKVELGGNVYVRGTRADGKPWRVGVRDPLRPEDANAFAGILELTDAYAITSGGYQRYFEADGVTYHHILDPATGRPADSGLLSVTVVADAGEGRGAMCDALSTALFVLGEDAALDFWRSGGYDFDLVLVTEDGRVLVTAGLADAFQTGEGTEYAYETVS